VIAIDRIEKLEKKIKELEKRLDEFERRLKWHKHPPNAPLKAIGKPFPTEGTPIIPEVEE